MKTVFNNSMCAHVFCAQTQSYGKGANTRFDGDTFYSYATPVARIVKGRKGVKVLLVSDYSYSVTTSKHTSTLIQAFSGRFFRVPSLGVHGSKVDHKANLAHLMAVHAKAKKRAKRAGYYDLDWSGIPIRDYCSAFGFKCRVDLDADNAEITAHREAAEARRNTPRAIRKRERAKELRATREDRMHMLEIAYAEKRERDNYGDPALGMREAIAENERRNAIVREAKTIEAWLAGEHVYLSYAAQTMEDGSARVRIKPSNADILETSQGAEVPMSHAQRLFNALRDVRGKENQARALLHGLRVGHFTVDNVFLDGSLRAGCHFIAWHEIERFANLMGW